MSSLVNNGNQKKTWAYKSDAKAVDFNNLFRDIIPAGIYSGGVLSVASGTTINIPAWSGIIHARGTPLLADDTGEIYGAVKITTKINYPFVAISGTPPADGTYYIYGLLTWAETANNYVGFYIRSTGSATVPNELIFGTVTISGGVFTTASAAGRHIGRLNTIQEKLDALMVTQGWSYSESVGGGSSTYPQYIILSNGTNRIRQNITWTASGVANGYTQPSVIVYELSYDSGTTYGTIATKTYTYVAGQLTAIAWS